MRFVTWLLTTSAGVAAAAWLLDGITIEGSEWRDKILPLLGASLVLGIVSMFVKPVVKVLSLPFIILTIGLFLLVINALMLLLTSWVAEQADIGFNVDGFWTAVVGSIIITIVTWFSDNAVSSD